MQKGSFRQKMGGTGQNPLENALRHHGSKSLNRRYSWERGKSKVLLRIKAETAYSRVKYEGK